MKEKRFKNPIECFWARTQKKDFNDCWEWKGGKYTFGHGCLRVNGKMTGSHRFSYEIHKGKIPEGMFVCHKCDNPSCVNPEHLFLGTIQDNNRDRKNKGRTHCLKGEKNPAAILDRNDVIQIRDLISIKMSQKEIAKLYGVSQAMISEIKNKKSWSHIV